MNSNRTGDRQMRAHRDLAAIENIEFRHSMGTDLATACELEGWTHEAYVVYRRRKNLG